MTLIELFDPHELAFPLVGQLEENFELEVIKEIPKDLNKRKSNLLIIVGKNFAELEQYKVLKEYYLAIVVFIKDMEATQIRTLQSTEETFDAFFGIPWQKTALKFYLQDLAEYKAMELKDELELTDKVKGNETKSALLQNLFDQAPDDGSLITSSIDTKEMKSNSEDEDNNLESQHHENNNSGIHLDLSGSDNDIDFEQTNTETEIDLSSGENDNSNDLELDLSSDSSLDDISEEDSDEDLFGLEEDGVELDFSDKNQEEAQSSSSDDLEFNDDDLDFSVHSELDNISEANADEPKIKEDHQPSLSLSEDAVEKLKEIDKILDNDSLSESSINEIAEEDSLDLSLSESDEDELDFSIENTEDAIDDEEEIESSAGDISLSVDMDDELDFGVEHSSNENIDLDQDSSSEDYTLAEESDLLDNDEEEAGTMMIGATQISELSTSDDMDLEVANELSNESHNSEKSYESYDFGEKEVQAPAPLKKENLKEAYKSEITSFDGDLERAAAIISELRSERDYLEKRVNELEKEKVLKESSTLDIRAELSEKTIELQLIKKRHQADISQFHQKLNEAEEARQLALSKKKYLEDEIRKLQSQMNFDVKKIKSRERELEDRIDLIKQDAEVQIRNRDSSIIDLKRKIDMLEFNLDNAIEKDKVHIESKFELESKVDKVMQTLRNAIGVLEDDMKNVNADDVGDNSNG